jgi:hypothetical protein
MALGSTQPLTEMSIRNLPGGKGLPAGRRVRLTTSQPSVSRLSTKMWEPQHLTALWAFTARYRDTFTFTYCSFQTDSTVLDNSAVDFVESTDG